MFLGIPCDERDFRQEWLYRQIVGRFAMTTLRSRRMPWQVWTISRRWTRSGGEGIWTGIRASWNLYGVQLAGRGLVSHYELESTFGELRYTYSLKQRATRRSLAKRNLC